MKYAIFTSLALTLASCSSEPEPTGPPSYTAEAPLPKNWPTPGPFDQVSEKTYPSYRAAVTDGSSGTFAFFRLFNHIKRQDIPMTAPVEMSMTPDGDDLDKTSMAFLYQNQSVGSVGADGKKVEVRDVPSLKVLSYTFMGKDTEKNIAVAREAIDAKLKLRGLTAKSYRLLGYNGPDTPDSRKTWELQAVL